MCGGGIIPAAFTRSIRNINNKHQIKCLIYNILGVSRKRETQAMSSDAKHVPGVLYTSVHKVAPSLAVAVQIIALVQISVHSLQRHNCAVQFIYCNFLPNTTLCPGKYSMLLL